MDPITLSPYPEAKPNTNTTGPRAKVLYAPPQTTLIERIDPAAETTERQSAAEAASVERLGALLENLVGTNNQRKPVDGSDEKLSDQHKDFRDVSLQPKPAEGLDIIPRVSPLEGDTPDRVRAIESRTKRRSSRGFARFLVAICIGVAGTLAWQSCGEATKQIIAQQLGWSMPATGPENTAAQLPVPKMPQAAPLAQVGAETVEQRLAAVRETVEQLAVGQDQVLREIAKLHEEIIKKIPASSPQLPALPARKPMPAPAPSSSRAPIPPPSSGGPIPPEPIPPPHP